ncbi:hypothetical protein KUCAC02_018408 [Chaenocephalus aceratus]|uniref:Uncharacterized protein n=1 Tax=Chaenocephalus aceratus TaxID=36190 RepID=A0ACB9W8F8_CHAAC|nr:hypothetical protein KUCAC02_018408 [Chaenocephalus aceratus]
MVLIAICYSTKGNHALHQGYNVIAQSGTGKTATFAISILQQLDIKLKETQALVPAPTRELAQQTCCF